MRKTASSAEGGVARARFYARRLRGLLRPACCVLTYHRVAATENDPFAQAVGPTGFERHLDLLKSSYPIEPLDVLLERLDAGGPEHGTVAVTFDDGYADTLETAAPLAASAGVPVHVFVTAGALGARAFWWDRVAAVAGPAGARLADLHTQLKRTPASERELALAELAPDDRTPADFGRPLTVEELRRLSKLSGVGIGSHTVSHPSLGALSSAEQEWELVESRRLLEEAIGGPVELLSYPFGKEADVGADTPDLAIRAGYAAAFTSVPLALTRRSHRFALPRLTIHDWPDNVLAGRLRQLFGY